MQRRVRLSMTHAAKVDLGHDTDPAEIVEDFGFNHDPHEVIGCWYALRNWGVLPVAGGWLDQPLALRDDLYTLQAIYNEEVDTLRQRIATVNDFEFYDDDTGAKIELGF